MDEKLFKTVTFGGFEKESVLLYIKELLSAQENELKSKNQEIEELQNQLTIQADKEKLGQSQQKQLLDALQEAQTIRNHLENTVLLKDDKIDSLQKQLAQMQEQLNKVQAQTRQFVEETNRRTAEQLKEMEEASNQKIKEAQQSASLLFHQIDAEYRGNRKKYEDMVNAINELGRYVYEAQKKANERFAVLPETLIKKADHE